jgi:hypothetical protein
MNTLKHGSLCVSLSSFSNETQTFALQYKHSKRLETLTQLIWTYWECCYRNPYSWITHRNRSHNGITTITVSDSLAVSTDSFGENQAKLFPKIVPISINLRKAISTSLRQINLISLVFNPSLTNISAFKRSKPVVTSDKSSSSELNKRTLLKLI